MRNAVEGFRKIYGHCCSSSRGLFSLNPSDIAVASGRSAEVVECEDLKLCCVVCVGRADLRRGNRSRSRTLAAGERREIGR